MNIRNVRVNLLKSSIKRKQEKYNAMLIRIKLMVGVGLVTLMLKEVNGDIVHSLDTTTKQKMIQGKIQLSKQIKIGGFVHRLVHLAMVILPKRFKRLRLRS